MPNSITDLNLIELAEVSDGDDIRMQRMAAELNRRRAAGFSIDLDVPVLELFCSKPVNRISHPKTIEAIERVIEAHKQGSGG